jgi:hypothetical protein
MDVPAPAHVRALSRPASRATIRFSAKQLQLKVLPVHLPVPPRPVVILTLKNRTLSPVAKLFVERARKTIGIRQIAGRRADAEGARTASADQCVHLAPSLQF